LKNEQFSAKYSSFLRFLKKMLEQKTMLLVIAQNKKKEYILEDS
jgi:hypothetical protein